MRNTKDAARGKWQDIIARVGGIDPKYLNGKHHRCPVTGEGENRFRFSNKDGRGNYFCACNPDGKGDGFDLLKCARGLEFKDALCEVERAIGMAKEDVVKKAKSDAKITSDLKSVASTFATNAAHVDRYLASRGLARPNTLRQAFTGYGLSGKRYDAMVGIIHNPHGAPVSMHLTYLGAGQKAPIEPNRVVMTPKGSIKGAAIRLYPILDGELAIAEGIESALSVANITSGPAWAVISANGMREFEPPPEVRRLRIYADADHNFTGQAAAFHLANRLALRRDIIVDVVLPKDRGTDANDVLLHNGSMIAC
jgi:putative DNA primase/helicase